MGAEVQEPLYFPRPPLWHLQKRTENVLRLSFVISFVISASSIFLGQAWADGKGKLATSRQRADSGGEAVKNIRRHSLDRLHASMNKQKKTNLRGPPTTIGCSAFGAR
jgi:hypothetical protein